MHIQRVFPDLISAEYTVCEHWFYCYLIKKVFESSSDTLNFKCFLKVLFPVKYWLIAIKKFLISQCYHELGNIFLSK